jgi:hypothetical protein
MCLQCCSVVNKQMMLEPELETRSYLTEMLDTIMQNWFAHPTMSDERLEHLLATAVDFQQHELPQLLSN